MVTILFTFAHDDTQRFIGTCPHAHTLVMRIASSEDSGYEKPRVYCVHCDTELLTVSVKKVVNGKQRG